MLPAACTVGKVLRSLSSRSHFHTVPTNDIRHELTTVSLGIMTTLFFWGGGGGGSFYFSPDFRISRWLCSVLATVRNELNKTVCHFDIFDLRARYSHEVHRRFIQGSGGCFKHRLSHQ